MLLILRHNFPGIIVLKYFGVGRPFYGALFERPFRGPFLKICKKLAIDHNRLKSSVERLAIDKSGAIITTKNIPILANHIYSADIVSSF